MEQPPVVAPTAPPTPNNMNESVVSLRHALDTAGQALSGIPELVTQFSDAPNGSRTTLFVSRENERSADERGFIPGAQDPDPGSNVPRLAQAYWRDQVVTRPALPARTRVWLPTEFHVRSTFGRPEPKTAVAVLGYNYFHGNLVGDGLYIATQSPVVRKMRVNHLHYTFDTRADFWIAVRTKNVRGVVMLSDWDEESVVPYLPLDADKVVYYAYQSGFPVSDGEIAAGRPGAWLIRVTVTLQSRTTNEKFGIVIRDLEARYAVRSPNATSGAVDIVEDDTPHKLRHCHYTRWPDGGIPTDPGDIVGVYATFMKELLRNTTNEPTMVHCLAGHGRTGTLLTTSLALRRHRSTNGPNLTAHLLQCFFALRMDRNFLVHNQVQLMFSYVCYVLMLKAVQDGANNVAVLDNVKRIHAALTSTRPAASIACVNCLEAIPNYSSIISKFVVGVATNFCSAACCSQYTMRNDPTADVTRGNW